MLTRTLLSSPLLVASLGLAPHLAGCLDTTIVGGEGGGGAGDVSTTGALGGEVTTTGEPGGAGGATNATAWLGAALDGPNRAETCAISPCPEEDDMLYLVVDHLGSSCTDALTSELWDDSFTTDTWAVVIGVPPSHQDVGVHVLDEGFYSQSGQSIAGESGPSGAVGAGGLGVASGTLEILELTGSSVRFVTRDTGKPTDGVEYAAPRCGVTTLPAEGIVLAGDAIGGGDGAAADDDGMTFVVGSQLAACTDALATTCDGDIWQVAVSLPGDYATPGTYSLSDPRITVTHCAALPKFLGGSIEVLENDGPDLVVRFHDVVDHEDELQQELRIDRCP